MKVLLITYYWPPCGGPGVQRALKFARYFPDFNVVPFIVTVDEKKASYPIIDHSLSLDIPDAIKVFRTDTSEPFGIYSSITKKKEIPHSGFANERKPGILQKISRFIRGNFYIPDARKGWNRYAFAQAMELIGKEKFDAIMTTSPPHSTQLVGLKLKKETGIPWIADLRDPWTDIYYYKDMLHTAAAKRKDASYERTVLENADEILVVSPAMKRLFEKKSARVNSDKIHVIPNGYDENDFSDSSIPSIDEFVITYTGTISANYGIANFIRVLSDILKKQELRFKLRFIGNTGNDVKSMIREAGIEAHVEYVSYLPHRESVSMLSKSTAVLLAIPQIENNEGILTGKLFEYLASCKPIICIGPEKGDAAEIIRECQAGKTFDYAELTPLKSYLESLLAEWTKNHDLDRKNETHLKYSRKKLTAELADVLSKYIS